MDLAVVRTKSARRPSRPTEAAVTVGRSKSVFTANRSPDEAKDYVYATGAQPLGCERRASAPQPYVATLKFQPGRMTNPHVERIFGRRLRRQKVEEPLKKQRSKSLSKKKIKASRDDRARAKSAAASTQRNVEEEEELARKCREAEEELERQRREAEEELDRKRRDAEEKKKARDLAREQRKARKEAERKARKEAKEEARRKRKEEEQAKKDADINILTEQSAESMENESINSSPKSVESVEQEAPDPLTPEEKEELQQWLKTATTSRGINDATNFGLLLGKWVYPLHVAIKANNMKMVDILLRAGARLNRTNDRHETPEDYARRRKPVNHELVELLKIEKNTAWQRAPTKHFI
eukprot:GEMP01014859.1.p1 GENE.GEMP01014859.1~~GEMP01014859.1.p1  ORF type:complete len:354 (+),score=73.59 GEMP01014859.1:38-1099(+)